MTSHRPLYRWVFSILLLSAMLVVHSVAANTDAPAEPEELRIEVYSPTALEVFWARWVIEDVAGYEVVRDGIVLEPLLDGLSFFDANLEPGQTYRYDVTTINSLGLRSPAVFVQVKMPAGDNTVAPAAKTPTGFSSQTYSATLLELFWDRPVELGLVYEVSRDGEVIGITDGVSFLDTDYREGAVEFYMVVAIAPDGTRSAAAKLRLGTDIAPPAPAEVVAFRYSATATELIWERPPEGSVMKTEIERDGELLQIVRGNSYFDDDRVAGLESEYALTAVDFNGQRSVTTRLIVPP
ncbi:MAG: hypothetical protein KTR33_09145, partial [Gammaproteobacteria bacterium]|nr:hypothetical protein [Gammaproteobacteria bacterium]